MAASELLDSLRDLDLPPAPAAESAGLLIVALMFFVFAIVVLLVTLHRRRQVWISEASELIRHAREHPPAAHLVELTSTLRRITVLRHADPHAHGDDWLKWLDEEFRTDYFTAGDGRIFGHGLYQRASAEQAPLDEINAALRHLLRQRWFRPW